MSRVVCRDDGTRGSRGTPGPHGFLDGCLFPVPWQAEGCRQVEGGVVDRQTMIRSPEVECVALGLAIRVEAVEGVFAQVHRQGALPTVALVEWAAAAELRRSAFEGLEQTQL